MKFLHNIHRGIGLDNEYLFSSQNIRTQPTHVLSLLARCPMAKQTPCDNSSALAKQLDITSIHIKDERKRMGLGSFKALGAAFVVARDASLTQNFDELVAKNEISKALSHKTYVTSSAGNHGLSLAASAKIFGARAVIYLSKNVPKSFDTLLQNYNAQTVITGNNYEESMAAAKEAAENNHWTLLSDSTWEGYDDGLNIMEGYLAMAAETVDQYGDPPPTHVFLQAGVGGLAAAMTAYIREHWKDTPRIIIVEPNRAEALLQSIQAKKPVFAEGNVSNMGRLDCKEPSYLALKCLAKEADAFMSISDDSVEQDIKTLTEHGFETSPSGGAGWAGLAAIRRDEQLSQTLDLGKNSRCLIILSEGKV